MAKVEYMSTTTVERSLRLEDAAKRPRHIWTDEERDIIRRDYSGNRASKRELAARLGVTEDAISGQVQYLGLGKIIRKSWTAEERDTLRVMAGNYSVKKIGGRLGRSVNSVVVEMKRLQVSRRNRDGWFSKREVTEILGEEHGWVQQRIDDGRLKASSHYGTRPQQKGLTMWHITEKDLKRYLRGNAHELRGRNVDIVMIVDILAGVTYDNPSDKIIKEDEHESEHTR